VSWAGAASLLTKLDVRDRAQLIIVAYETGLMSAHRAMTH
jgi:hypothetical protein